MGTCGPLSDEGTCTLGVIVEIKNVYGTFSKPQKLRHSFALHFLCFLNWSAWGIFLCKPSTYPGDQFTLLRTVGLITDMSLIPFYIQYRGQVHGGIQGDFSRNFPVAHLFLGI